MPSSNASRASRAAQASQRVAAGTSTAKGGTARAKRGPVSTAVAEAKQTMQAVQAVRAAMRAREAKTTALRQVTARRAVPGQAEMLTVREPQQVRALNHPTRVAILEALREPMAAASVARAIGQPRQLVSYHMRMLAEAGLIALLEERRKGNFVEGVSQAVARSFTVAADVSWTPQAAARARQQHALGSLHDLGGRIQRDAATLLARSDGNGVMVPAASGVVEMRIASAAQREAFMHAYMNGMRSLAEQHSSRTGEMYRIALAIYPAVGGEAEERAAKGGA